MGVFPVRSNSMAMGVAALRRMPTAEAELRTFAKEAGLAEDSKFLSHWFGASAIHEETTIDEALPRPSPWNCFVRETRPYTDTAKNGFALRAFAQENNLADDSKFLGHWF